MDAEHIETVAARDIWNIYRHVLPQRPGNCGYPMPCDDGLPGRSRRVLGNRLVRIVGKASHAEVVLANADGTDVVIGTVSFPYTMPGVALVQPMGNRTATCDCRAELFIENEEV